MSEATSRLDPSSGQGSPSPGHPRPLLPSSERRRRRREWWIAVAVALGLAVVLLLERQLLSFGRDIPIARNAIFLGLVHLNVVGIAVLVFLCGRNVVKLVVERRRGILGSKLNTKFVVAFAFMAAVSTTVLFVFSGFLVTRSVDTWFELEISDSLGESLEVAAAYYEQTEESSLHLATQLAGQIEARRLLREDALERLRSFVAEKQIEYNLGVVEVFSAQQELLASATHPDVAVVSFAGPDSELIRAGLEGTRSAVVEAAGPGELIRAGVPIRSTFQGQDVVGVVVVNSFIPRSIGTRIARIHAALDSYRRIEPSQGALATNLWLLLAMITLSILLFSSWIGFRLAKQVTVPIQRLAAAATEIAAGNLDVQIDRQGDDEIGLLIEAFNRMATDIRLTNEDLEQRSKQMEVILRGVAAGVIALDAEGRVASLNPSAMRLLQVGPGPYLGRKVGEVVEGSGLAMMEEVMRRLGRSPAETVRMQAPVTVGDDVLTLNWIASRLRDVDGAAAGFVLVIDDVTQILAAQRTEAWRDVARRMAHEIKNPLTPIQLSAQRLRRNLADGLDGPRRQLLEQSTDAIMGQVEALKLLVSEFSRFSRLPATDPVSTDLNALVRDTVSMYQEKADVSFRTHLDPELPALDLDREQIKRVILNLLDNALGAVDEVSDGLREVRVSTAADRTVGTVRLEVADTGCGVPAEVRRKLFEPYFSTKRNGSGLGLSIVSRIVSDHSGYIRVRDNQPRGTRFIVELPTSA